MTDGKVLGNQLHPQDHPLSTNQIIMECKSNMPRLEVETEESIYEIELGQIQIEITGRCNMWPANIVERLNNLERICP